MKTPTLRTIQQLYPLGPIEFDDQARKELNAVVNFRNLFLAPTEQFMEQETTTRLNDMIATDNESRQLRSITQNDHDVRVFQMVSEIMVDEDSYQPGVDVLITDITAQSEVDIAKTLSERAQNSFGIPAHFPMALPTPDRFSFGSSRCVLHGVLHWLFRYTTGAYLYRMHPQLRFPVHRLIEFNIDVPDGSTTPVGIITGYKTALILALQTQAKFEVPDTTEGLFNDREDDEETEEG